LRDEIGKATVRRGGMRVILYRQRDGKVTLFAASSSTEYDPALRRTRRLPPPSGKLPLPLR
jgi:hypothetical protein